MIKNCLTVLLLLVIVRLIAFFAGSETAYLSISKIQARRLISQKAKNARLAARLKENVDELLTIILIGINFLNTLGSAIATALAIELTGSSGVGVATLCFTFLSTIFGEIVPKTVAGRYTENVYCKNAKILFVLEKVFFPVVFVFSAFSKGTAFLAKNLLRDEGSLVTEEELKTLIDLGEKEGTLEASEKNMLYKIFRFNDLTVRRIMKHRSFVKSVEKNATREQIVQMFVQTGLSMLPVYEESPESIIGVIHYKAVLLTTKAAPSIPYATSVMKDVLFVPETLTALELLAKFKKERTNFAVCLDEQGQMSGVVTIDDILHVVFSRMVDEDNATVPPEEKIRLVSSNEFIVPGDMSLDDVNSILKLKLESEEFVTLGGWLMEQFDSLPSTGEICSWKNVLFFVEDQSHRRIRQVRIKFV